MKSKTLKVDDDILLRFSDPTEAEEMFAIVNAEREYLGEWLSWVEQTRKVDDTRKYLMDLVQWNLGGQQFGLTIYYKGKICGCIGFVSINKIDNNAEIGYWLSEKHQGKGIMTKACKRLLRYGFEKMDFNRIQIRVITSNAKSIAIPKRLGFMHEGIIRQSVLLYGVYHDAITFSLLKEEFEKN